MSTWTDQITQAVRAAVASAEISVVVLSEQTGIPRTTLQRRLQGVSEFTVGEVDRIAQALGVPHESLVQSTENVA